MAERCTACYGTARCELVAGHRENHRAQTPLAPVVWAEGHTSSHTPKVEHIIAVEAGSLAGQGH